ncbi:MAG: hypothetical protein MMC33_003653 [Icmadophila ericetorum]|nr:hypothetical protein [Icmadophila ericetorum]
MLQDLIDSVPDDLPPIEQTSHLKPLDRPAQFAFFQQNGECFKVTSTPDSKFVRANRSYLRDWLATNLDVQWDKHMTKIEETDKSVTLFFLDGTSATGDVLVGADGVHSPTRAHLCESKNLLQTVPVGMIGGETTLNREQYESVMEIGNSAFLARGEVFNIFVGLNSVAEDASTAKYYWMFNWVDEKAAQEPYWTASASKQELYDYAMKHIDAFDPKFVEVVRLTPVDGVRTPPLVLRDLVLKEMPNRRVTLVGDAAHPMTPFRGQGGNEAIKDSLNLARAIAKSTKTDFLPALKEYQEEMLVRGGEAVIKSREAIADGGTLTKQVWQSFTSRQRQQPSLTEAVKAH